MLELIATLSLAAQLALSGHYHDGLQALQAKKYDNAIASLTQVIDNQDPDNTLRDLARHYRAEAYRGRGDKPKALADWTALLQANHTPGLRETFLAGFQAVGGDPKTLVPQLSPKEVWAKFVAAAQASDLEAALALSTNQWRELVGTETRGDGSRLLREFGRDQYQTGQERLGQQDQAGKAWLELSRAGRSSTIELEFVRDPKANAWLISGFRKNRDRPSGPAQANLNRLKQIAVGLQIWAADHEQALPGSLAQLEHEHLPEPENLMWHHPQTGQTKAFVYCPGLSLRGPRRILVAAPAAVGGQREVLYTDGTTSLLEEESFLKAALAQKWALADSAAVASKLSAAEQEQVRQLIQQLGAPQYQARQAAREKLAAMGASITAVLAEFRDSPDPEIRGSVAELLAGQ